MASDKSEIIWQLAKLCLKKNYDYFYLHAMLEKAKSLPGGNATLITGSSHALNAIYEPAWEQAVNCSMHSQDIYYDFQCAKAVLSAPGNSGKYSRCFINFMDTGDKKHHRSQIGHGNGSHHIGNRL